MTIELIGEPSDGLLFEAPYCVPPCFSVPTDTNVVRAIYQSACQCGCHRLEDEKQRFYFCGYDVLYTSSDEHAPDRQRSVDFHEA